MTTNTPTIQKDRPEGCNRVGTVQALSGLSVEEFGFGNARQTRLTLVNVPLSITDALAYSGQKLYTFPEGIIYFKGCTGSIAFTTTSAIASTLNSGVTVQWGLGSATASATTLATTMINMLTGTGVSPATFTSSTVINVAPATATAYFSGAAAKLDGTGTAIAMYLNLALGTATDIDADATLVANGTITFTWEPHGDY